MLLSAPAAAASTGPAWFKALSSRVSNEFPDAAIEPVLDCGDRPGHAIAALRNGLKTIRYDGPAIASIEDIARKSKARVLRDRPTSLDLETDLDEATPDALVSACLRWLTDAGPPEGN